jgi:hypothetical protein
MRMSAGVDLHKGQFTVCWRGEDGSVERSNRYPTTKRGYGCFEAQLSHYMEKGHEVRVAVESTGNTRYFLRRMERVGVEVKLINTMKFKVVAVNNQLHGLLLSLGIETRKGQLQRNEESDPLQITDPAILKTAFEMRMAVVTAA